MRERVKVMQFKTIEIDFDVHRCIENERRSFAESPNDALRRLLRLPAASGSSKALASPSAVHQGSWSAKGVSLQNGTLVRMDYNQRRYEGAIVDGKWVIGAKSFDSPSGAASGVGLTKGGRTTRLDGWKYWEVKRPGDENWVLLGSLIPKAALSLSDLGL